MRLPSNAIRKMRILIFIFQLQVGKTKDLGARVMAQWIKYVLCKPESAQHPCECQAEVLAGCNPSDQEAETGCPWSKLAS